MKGNQHGFRSASIGELSVHGHYPSLPRVVEPPLDTPENATRFLRKIVIMDKEIKDKRVEFRVPEKEKKLWNAEAKARKISVGELIRNAVMDFLGKIRDLVFVRKETIEHARIVAISRLSNNLNQIARNLNSALKYENPINVLNTQAKLVEILNEAMVIEDLACGIENGDERLAILEHVKSNFELHKEILSQIRQKNSI